LESAFVARKASLAPVRTVAPPSERTAGGGGYGAAAAAAETPALVGFRAAVASASPRAEVGEAAESESESGLTDEEIDEWLEDE
jgi:hypothetical protein